LEYRAARATFSAFSWLILALLFAFFSYATSLGMGFVGSALISGVAFLVAFIVRRSIFQRFDEQLYDGMLGRGASRLMTEFVERVRTCFTMPEFVTSITEGLERSLDASVLLIRSNTWDIVYASPATLTADPNLLPMLKRNFRELSEGLVFIDDRFNLTVSNLDARGFSVFCRGYYFFVFSLPRCFDVSIKRWRI